MNLINKSIQNQDFTRLLTWRLLIPMTIVLSVLILTGAVIIWVLYSSRINDQLLLKTKRVSSAFHSELDDLSKRLDLLIISITEDPLVKESLISNGKEKLLTIWGPIYKKMNQDHGINHFSFLDNSRQNILRIHNPALSGDTIKRLSALKAERTKAVTSGIEIETGSRELLTFRIVSPVFSGSELAGYTELGIDIASVLNEIHDRTSIPLMLLINRAHVSDQKYKNYLCLNSNLENFQNLFKNHVLAFSTFHNIPSELAERIEVMENYQNSSMFDFKFENKSWRIKSLDVPNVEGTPIGKLLVFIDTTDLEEEFSTVHFLSIFVSILLAAGLFLFMFAVLKNTDKKIASTNRELFLAKEKFEALVKSSPDIITIIDESGTILFSNETGLNSSLITINGNKAGFKIEKENFQKFNEAIEEAFSTKSLISVEIPVNGNTYEHRITPVVMEQYEDSLMIISTDITIRKNSEKIIKKYYERFSAILNASSNGFLLLDNKGIIKEVNNNVCEILDFYRNELVGKKATEIEALKCFEIINIKSARKIELTGEVFERKHRKKNGKNIILRISFTFNPTSKEYLSFITDITTEKEIRREFEKKLEISNERFLLVEESAQTGFWDWDIVQNTLHWSDQFKKIFEYTGEDSKINIELLEGYIHPEDKEVFRYILQDSLKKNHTWELECRIVTGSGKIKWLYSKGRIHRDSIDQPVRMLGIIVDISERIKNEELIRQQSEQLLALLRTTSEGLWITDASGRFLVVNDAYLRMSGYTRDEILKMSIPDMEVNESEQEVAEHMRYVMENEFDVFESKHRRKDGTIYDLFISVSYDEKRNEFIVFLRDISEKKKQEAKILEALTEKEILLNEVHHRVKNNLQIISSLVYLQSLKIKNASVKDYFDQVLNRIKTIALVHEHLYQAKDYSKVDFMEYISELISIVKETYYNPNTDINVVVESHAKIKFEKAIYCGLIINELLSNSFKHAFKGMSRGEIKIKFTRENGNYLLAVSDNGLGIQDTESLKKENSMGIVIVQSLVEQLKGKITFNMNNGTTIDINFPV